MLAWLEHGGRGQLAWAWSLFLTFFFFNVLVLIQRWAVRNPLPIFTPHNLVKQLDNFLLVIWVDPTHHCHFRNGKVHIVLWKLVHVGIWWIQIFQKLKSLLSVHDKVCVTLAKLELHLKFRGVLNHPVLLHKFHNVSHSEQLHESYIVFEIHCHWVLHLDLHMICKHCVIRTKNWAFLHPFQSKLLGLNSWIRVCRVNFENQMLVYVFR